MEAKSPIYITKYALTRGILASTDYELLSGEYCSVKGWLGLFHLRDVYMTLSGAKEKATLMRDSEMVRLEKKLGKLKMMTDFNVSEI